jgi:spore coat polysaccharide biosynthesis predicted glycosyltransferase SpsG
MAKINLFCKASLMHGMGHLIRQIHIAEKIRDHNDIFFYIPDFPAAANILKQYRFSFSTVENFVPAKADITILDIQDTPLAFIQDLKQQSKKIISFEDQSKNPVDLLIDCNLNPDDKEKIPPNTKILFGLPYAVLAPEFEQLHSSKRNFTEQIHSLLVTFGGTDPHNITFDLTKHIPDHFKTTIVAGFQNQNALQELGNAHVVQNVQDMARTLADHDAVFCSGGVTLHEAMCVGTPAFVINQVEHQEDKAKAAEGIGAAINLGQAKSWDKNRLPEIFKLANKSLQTMSAAGKKCIDGKGLKRVVEAILSV